jgi:dipeptidyl aminopeptidase/acylaminoacyl peptidase
MRRLPFLAAFLLSISLLAPTTLLAEDRAEEQEPVTLPVTSLLATGTVPLVSPAFGEAEKAGIKADDLFGELPALPGGLWPAQGTKVPGPGGELKWSELKDDDGQYGFGSPDQDQARYLAFYVYSDRYQKAQLKVTTDQKVKAFLNGAKLSLDKKDQEEGPAHSTGELTLPVGKHLVVLRTLFQPAKDEEEKADGKFQLGLTRGENGEDGSLTICSSPQRPVDIDVILNSPRVGRTAISPDGTQVIISLSEYRDGKNRESWIEIRDTRDGKLTGVFRADKNPRGLNWSPDGKLVCWETSNDDKSTIWFFDQKNGETGLLLEDIADMGRWVWAPDGQSILYSVSRTPDEDKRRVKRVLHPADRQSWWRGRSHLMQAFVPGGMTRRLTAGPLSPNGWDISPDSKHLLFFTSEPDLTNRPYYTNELWLMDLETLETTSILNDLWIGGASWGPDKDVILLSGSPSAFNGLGRNLAEGVQANDYGGQLYLYDLKSREPTFISQDLRPDVGWSDWNLDDGLIYARCTDTQYTTIYRYHPGKKTWSRVDTGFECTNQIALPRKGHIAVARGTSATEPNKVTTVDLKSGKVRELLDPGADEYRDIVFGKVENWPVTLDSGMELDGFIYYPPMFDPEKTYPLIVYYYGGTSPVGRDFGGRYPKNTWAAQGYIVYVPNPSGATGYGQDFAAKHVNDWGKLTGPEVIEGTEKFLVAHPYADPEAIGCIGASYGGFLTQYIITQTDLFAAAVSHAGISSISSYWGEGLWGYVYGARALANTFPWKDQDLYVGQSPLFQADKITTPLLLVHGDSDTNVPVGESDQMFTALKMLGKEVEYVQVKGQDHWIQDHEQRVVWHDTILAFFAKHLKKREAWWNAMYPEPEDY